ncbi:hypothetical protein HEP81_04645 [Streptomyces griseofuscus]|uniref:Uncharacterized protein n=1 Tax=Streptomyces griseofuscus TaxID=146922 RepID=A0A7H1Q3N8_9ACTN|nr:hypothetical protein [Streptomyces griseofuscus]QNT94918.1 hypothetical protein HEP81_04645 [Streptomyces griseofuscus]
MPETPAGQIALFGAAPVSPLAPRFVPAPVGELGRQQTARPRREPRRRTTAADLSARLGGATHLAVTFAPGILWPWLEQLRPELVRADGDPSPVLEPGTLHVHVNRRPPADLRVS